MSDYYFEIAKLCGFDTDENPNPNYNSGSFWTNSKLKTIQTIAGTFSPPVKDIFFKIKGKPSRRGTIGKLVNAEIGKYSNNLEILFIGFDDRKNILKFKYWELEWLKEHEGPTVYVYKQTASKQNIKPITNKFGQTLEIDDLVVAIGGSYGSVEIVFGYVSRWTEAGTLFIKPYGPFGRITNSNKGDVKIKNAKQCIRLPKDAKIEEDLFTCVIGADYK